MRFDGSLVRSQGDIATLARAAIRVRPRTTDGRMLRRSTPQAHVIAAGAARRRPRPAFPTTRQRHRLHRRHAEADAGASLVPFEVRTPLWSDGAKKHRFIILPGQQDHRLHQHGRVAVSRSAPCS